MAGHHQPTSEKPVTKGVSKCCSAEIKASIADEGTGCYMCKKCGKPTDPATVGLGTAKGRIALNKQDANILFYAFRYALQRRTAAVCDVVEYILKYWAIIPTSDKEQMKHEIRHELAMSGEIPVYLKEYWDKILDKKI